MPQYTTCVSDDFVARVSRLKPNLALFSSYVIGMFFMSAD